MKETCTLRDGSGHGKIILGAWQLSEGHSQRQEKDETLLAYLQNSIDTIDCADIYTGVEQAIGKVITQLQTLITPPLPRVHTKHVPDLDTIRSGNISPETTRSLIDTSIARIRKNCLDLVQFHHWDYDIYTYKTSVHTLITLQKEGKINGIGITNSSVEFLKKLESECDFVPLTTQNQYNIIDRRPEKYLFDHTTERDITFYGYGSIMGGLLSSKYLGAPEPVEPLENRSLRKYLRIIEDWGDWNLFQQLLETLDLISKKHHKTISEVAMRWVLDNQSVGAIICGARHPTYAKDMNNLSLFRLTDTDRSMIDVVYKQGRAIEGDVFDIERYEPRHRDIIKLNLNAK